MISKLPLFTRWKECHWFARSCAVGVVGVILLWQARYTVSVHNPMFGWPMPFDNLWYVGQRAWSPHILVIDAVVWVALAASTAFVVDRWLRTPQKTRLSLRGLLGIQAAVAVVLAAGFAEYHLRYHPNNDSIFPKYGKMTWADTDFWFDIGLFSDPLLHWPLLRLPVIVAIECLVFTGINLLAGCFGKHRGDVVATSTAASEPAFARIIERVLVALVMLFALGWLLLPKLY